MSNRRYIRHTSQRYEDEKRQGQYAFIGLFLGAFIGFCLWGWLGALAGVFVGGMVGAFVGAVVVTFD